jgi:exodeoxyribonuclease V beta subunit
MSARHPALASFDAPTLVEASAGTGKTYTITTYFVRAILEKDLEPDQILIVTYTKAATADLRRRARERIVEAIRRIEGPVGQSDLLDDIVPRAVERLGRVEAERRLRNALASMDQAAILTIHGFCQRLLQDHPLEFGIDFDFDVGEDLSSVHGELATDYWAATLYDRPAWMIEALRSKRVTVDLLARLADKALSPRVPLLGPKPIAVDTSALDRALEARTKVGELWLRHREEVAAILTETKGLNGNSYRKASVPKWFDELDSLAAKRNWKELPEWFDRISQGHMRINKGFEEPVHPFFQACRELLDSWGAVEPMLDYAVFEFQQDFLDYAEEAMLARRVETGVLSYDDLLTIVHAAVVNDDSVARLVADEYPLALVDEFQDTDSVQYGIFRATYGEGACVYVGDPKQAIYAFRGADVFSYIEATRDVGENRRTLSTNYRSDPSMVDAVNMLFARRTHPFLETSIGFDAAEAHEEVDRLRSTPALDFVWLDEEHLKGDLSSVAETVANEVAHLLRSEAQIEERDVEAGDIAVLCRSNRQARVVAEALRALNVPTSLEGDSSVLATETATSMRAILEAALLPGDSRALRRAMLTPLLGVTACELVDMDDKDWTTWVTQFQRWHELWRTQGVIRFVENMLRETHAEARLAKTPSAKRDLTDLLHVEELLMRGEREHDRDPIALMQWYRRLDEGSPDEGMVRTEDLQQRPDAESGAVRVTTIHKSKGLEYGVVFCPYTWRDANLFSDEQRALKFHDGEGAIKLDLGSANHDANEERAKHEKLSEALRVLYVALTRAKYRCTVFWGRAKGWQRSALAQLLHGSDLSKSRDEADLQGELFAFASSSGGVIGARDPIGTPAMPLEDRRPGDRLEARPASRGYDLAPRIGSFSSLTGHDEKTPLPRSTDEEEPVRPPLFAALPGGTRTGLLLHSILERCDFEKLADDPTIDMIEGQLRDYGLPPELAPEIRSDLSVVANTPLVSQPNPPTLVGIERSLRELEFTLSLDRPRLQRLAEILERHGAPVGAPGYPSRLRELDAESLQSFLRGYIDLVFEWEGRWYVADYKSNSLPNYGAEAVTEAVQREHYVLQALLYSAATQRYLSQRIDDFSPSEQWGGAMFLFLRGMAGADAPGGSVFFDPLSNELLDALDAWLGGTDETR